MRPDLERESRPDHPGRNDLEARLEAYTVKWDRALGEDEFGLRAAHYANKVRAIKNAMAIQETPGVTPEYTDFDHQIGTEQKPTPAHRNIRELNTAQVILTTLRMIVKR